MTEFDLICLGGGSGGIAMAVRAATHGARVAVIEKDFLGGTCVNLGCVPKKVMFYGAEIASNIKKATDYGFDIKGKDLDFGALVQARQSYIQRLRGLYQARFEKLGITLIQGKGKFSDTHTIKVGEHHYTAAHIVIACGGRPLMPDIKGIEHALSSDGFFDLKRLPKKVAIVGGGYIGVEIAGVLNSLGSEVHLFMRNIEPLGRFDKEIGKHLANLMQKQGVILHPNCKVNAITLKNNKKNISCGASLEEEGFDEVILATGRVPQTDNIGLENTDIQIDSKGMLTVDDYQNSNVPGIYAIGDITGKEALTPIAIASGRKLAERLFNHQPNAKLDDKFIPTVVFSHPPVATVGMSEQQAINHYGEQQIKVYKSQFNPMFDALSEDKIPTLMKLVVQGANERIVGLHMVGLNCDEILQGFAVAIKMGALKKDFDDTLAIHPTSAEELVTMT